MSAPSIPSRYLSIWLRRLPTDRLTRRRAAAPDEPERALVVAHMVKSALRIAALNDAAARLGLTVGTALAGQRIAVLTPGGEAPVAAGAEGEICIVGPSLMKGYVPAAAREDGPSIRNGWLRTGDLGWLDDAGYLTVSGRLKEIIIRGGENLSPGRIEEAILHDPSVRGCCVVGAPDADLGEVPVAFVVARDGVAVRGGAIQERVRAELPRSYVPARVIVLEALPEIGIGKIDRGALKRLAANA